VRVKGQFNVLFFDDFEIR